MEINAINDAEDIESAIQDDKTRWRDPAPARHDFLMNLHLEHAMAVVLRNKQQCNDSLQK